jgi:hypothetical protein
MKVTGIVWNLLTPLVVPTLTVWAQELPLVKNGASDYVIVVSKNASPSEQWAAEELMTHIKQMTGAELKVQEEGGSVPALVIVIGFGPTAESLGVEPDEALGPDGFVVKTIGHRLVIAGGRRAGTMYGVHTLLERLGCRWWTLTESTIPQTKSIEIPTVDLREVPKLEYRDMMYGEMWGSDKTPWFVWAARNKINGMGWEADVDPKYGGYPYTRLHQSYADILESAGVVAPEEALAMVEGQRNKGSLCLTSDAASSAVAQAIRKMLGDKPEQGFVAIGPETVRGAVTCSCEVCKAAIAKEGMSGLVVRFTNRVAESLEKDWPKVKVLTSPGTEKPPGSVRARPNVMVLLGTDACDFGHPIATTMDPATQTFRQDLDGWNQVAPGRLLLWDHAANQTHYLMPHPNLDVLTANIRYYVGHGAAGVFSQGSHASAGGDFSPLKMWVVAKSLWNPEADGQALIDEFLKGYYGPAAGALGKYIDVIHQPLRESDFALRKEVPLNGPWIAPKVIAEAEAALRKADEAAAGDTVLERRVRHAHLPVRYVLARRGPGSATWKATEAKVGKIDFVKLAVDLAQAVKEYGINRDADGPHYAQTWVEWVNDYARRVAENGVPIPPELKDADPTSYRLLTAGMLDSYYPRDPWLKQMDGTSGGWALGCPETKWHVQYYFSPYDDMKPGLKYTLSVRVKGEPKTADGVAFAFGVHSDVAGFVKFREVNAADVPTDRFAAFELEGIEMPRDGFSMFGFYLGSQKPMPRVYLDCMWLAEMPSGPAGQLSK